MARIDLVDLAHSYGGNDAPPDFRHRDTVARPDPVRRRRYHTAVNPEAQYRASVPVSGDLRHHDGRTKPGIPAEESRASEGRDRCPGGGDRAAARPDTRSFAQGDPADRRRQAEDLAGPWPG